ncbi:helix-turn-helix domain-containing protein [Ktedonosporobacter rubrisoli]|uniref:Helix-turn-helix domain-containing protein n=1 Tax=Ktedonosporobacter rubrisoli TaxID=2509675 RepID=A0A4P6JMY8_KTERU|nr:DJ-1/PfpI family protein [Ktedonosporobacter rubrisoli]QBD76402.1 helix-turn-helix domain-containing protein [Ktedonosporobacter rubrisoli]
MLAASLPGTLYTRDAPDSVQRVIFLLLPQVNLLDLAGPAQTFDAAIEAGAAYKLLFCANQPELLSAQGLGLAHLQPLPEVSAADLILIPGLRLKALFGDAPLQAEVVCWLKQAAATGAHIASICTGAFVLGEAGLLDGRRCTTHWQVIEQLRTNYPRARVLDSILFVHDGYLITSAGIASGIDMTLSLLEQKHGPLFAAQAARYLVVYMRRNGSQAQESLYLQYRTHLNPSVHKVQDHLISHIAEPGTLSDLARIGQMSIRSLTRSFKEATGLTLVQYHQRLQIELAANLLNNPALSIEEVATKCGFEDARHFRRLWLRQYGVPPSVSRSAHQLRRQSAI